MTALALLRRLLERWREKTVEGQQMSTETQHMNTKWLDLEYLEIPHAGQRLRFAASGRSSVKRARSLFEKEPITISWIDNFARGETLFDIGANVGTYTIYAAVMKDANVYAFEPEALNYAELNKNIFLNDLHGKVIGYCLALSNHDKTDRLLLSDFGLGISHHDFEENSWTEDKQFAPDWLCKKDDRRIQGCIGRTVDSLIADGLPVPDHVKIDVDGLEHKVVAGMAELLKNPKVKTVLVEINFDSKTNLDIIDSLCAQGWKFSWDQLRCNRAVKFTVEQIVDLQRRGRGGLNYIFYRDDSYTDFFARYFEEYVPPLSRRNG